MRKKWHFLPHYLLAVPLLSLVLVLLDNPLILGTQVRQNGAQLRPAGTRVHLHIHLVSGNTRLHLLQFLQEAEVLFVVSK